MKNWIWLVTLIAAGTALVAQNRSGGEPEGTAYSISFFEDEMPLSHTVTEVGDDFVVLRDIAGITETTVPVFSVKAVEKMQTNLG